MKLQLNQLSQTRRRGAALIEYSLLIAGVGLMSSAALAVFGHKTSDLISATASILPGAHADDNGPIISGKLIETAADADGNITLNTTGIAANSDTPRLGNNLGVDLSGLVLEAGEEEE